MTGRLLHGGYNVSGMTDEERVELHRLLSEPIDEGLALADWFDEQVANAPRTFHPTHSDVMRAACADANLSALIRRMHPRDAARQAAHGYDIERELADVGPEPSDLDDDEPIACCPTCGDPLEFVTPDNDYCFNCGHVFDAAIVARVRSSSTALMCESCGAVLYGEYGPYVAPWESSCWKCGKSMVAS